MRCVAERRRFRRMVASPELNDENQGSDEKISGLGAQIRAPGGCRGQGGPAWRPAPLAAFLFSGPRLAADAISSRRRRGILQWVSGFPSGATVMTLTIEAIYENGVLKPSPAFAAEGT